MLADATKGSQGGNLTGSVILLTDGDPDPQTDAQVAAVRNDLVPQFKSHGWPIDTIALGKDQGLHGFLSDVASGTSGSFYDDGHGVIPGVSPLNITPFFLDIFKLRVGRSPGPDIPPTQLGGGRTSRNFTVGQYVTHLDVVVVKDNRDAAVSIVAPNGQRIADSIAGTFVSKDPYYAIFSIDAPQQGPWQLDVSGNGQFLMNSLKTSALALSVTAPGKDAVLALGEPFTITAALSNNGTTISGGRFAITGTLTYVGGDGKTYAQDVVLNDANGSGQYTAQVTLPTSAPPGSYKLAVDARAASEDVLSAQVVLRAALFPSAVLLSPGDGKPTTDAVGAQVVRFDPVLQYLYYLPPISWIGGWPLNGLPSTPSALLHGQVFLNGKPYAQAQVTGVASRPGGGAKSDATILNDGNGAFRLLFPAGSSGTYNVALTSQGAYSDVHGDLTTATRIVQVTVTPATPAQEVRAWLVTAVYLFLLLLIVLVIRAILAPKPFGMLAGSDGGGEEFARARRGPLARLLAPSVVTSSQMGLDPGLRFRFHHGGRVTVRAAGRADGYLIHGEPVPRAAVSAGEAHLTSADGAVAYTVSTARSAEEGGDGDAWGEAPPRRGVSGVVGAITGRPQRGGDDYDDWGADDDRPRRGLRLPFGRGGRGADDDMRADPWGGDDHPARGSKSAGGGRRSRKSEWEDDW